MIPVPAQVQWVFFDVGDTMIYLDVDRVAEHLRGFGMELTGPELLQAQARTRPLVDRAVLDRQAAYAQAVAAGETGPPEQIHREEDAYLRWIGAILRTAAPEVESAARRQATASLRSDGNGSLWTRIDPYLVETLEILRGAGLKLGVISNAEGTVEERLTGLGLGAYFETVLDSAVVGVEKPHRAIFDLALERTGAPRDRTVHVGDFYSFDIVGARGAGLAGVLVDPSETYCRHYPDVPAVASLRALPALLGVV